MTRLSPWKRHWGGNGGALTEWSAHPLERFRQEFNEMMERFFENFPAFAEERGWNVEVDDRDDELVVHAEAPGFAPEDFNVQVAGNYLRIHAEHKEEGDEEGASWRRYGAIHETIPLPPGVDVDRINAHYRNGILNIHIPKGEEAKGKRIEVKGG